MLSAKRRGFLQNLEENEDENENQQARRHMINNMDDEDNEYERRCKKSFAKSIKITYVFLFSCSS